MKDVVAAALLAILIVGDYGPARCTPLETLGSAQQTYDAAVRASDTTGLRTALHEYVLVRETIVPDSLHAYEKVIRGAQYGAAWCLFRLGELTGRAEFFAKSYRSFDSVSGFAGGSMSDTALARLRGYVAYMSAEARLREAQVLKYERLDDDGNLSSGVYQEIISKLDTAVAGFHSFASSGRDLSTLLLVSGSWAIREQDCRYEKGIIALLAEQNDTAQGYFNAVKYDTLTSDNRLGQAKGYSEAAKIVKQGLAGGFTATMGIDAQPLTGGDSLLLGNWYHALAMEAVKRSQKDSGSTFWQKAVGCYDRAQNRFKEAYYWKGLGQLVFDDAAARGSFLKFLNWTRSDSISRRLEPRLAFLSDDANRICALADQNLDLTDNSALRRVLGITEGNRKYQQALDGGKYLLNRATNDIRSRTTLHRYLKNAISLFTYAVEAPRLSSEARFYQGITLYIRGANPEDPAKRYTDYRDAADCLQGVLEEGYKAEARYIRARCQWMLSLNPDSKNSERMILRTGADSEFKNLVREKKSIRALYRLAEMLTAKEASTDCSTLEGTQADSCKASYYLRNLIYGKAGGSNECRYLALLIGDSLSQPRPTFRDAASRVVGEIGFEDVICPDYLISVSGQEFFFEMVSEANLSGSTFADEGLKQLRRFGPEKKSLYPTDNPPQKSLFLRTSFEDVSANIPDKEIPSSAWNLNICLYSESGVRLGSEDNCNIQLAKDDRKISAERSGCFDTTNITAKDTLRLLISADDYYETFLEIPPRWFPMDTVVVLTHKIGDFKPCPETWEKFAGRVAMKRPADKDSLWYLFDSATFSAPGFAKISDQMTASVAIRNCVYDSSRQDLLATNRREKFVYQASETDKISLRAKDGAEYRFDCPEGIAVDRGGNIYVADWGGHHIVVFDKKGILRSESGLRGDYSNKNNGDTARLTFPTHVAIEEAAGVPIGGKTYYPEKHILVADRYGIHRFDSRGRYLDTPIPAEAMPSGRGSLYSFLVTGYGEEAKIAVIDRASGKVLTFAPKCQ